MYDKLIKILRKIYYLIKNVPYRFQYKNIIEIEKNGILLVTHDFEKQGAELLLLYMSKYYHSIGIPIVIISRKYGPLEREFKKYCYTKVLSNVDKIDSFISTLKEYNYDKAILNTAVNGDLAYLLKKHDYKVLLAIHELDNTIISSGYISQTANGVKYSNFILFPSNYVAERLNNIVKIESEKIYCKHQGLFLTKGLEIDKLKSRNYLMDIYNNITKEDLIVLNVATAGYRKGIDLFIDLAIKANVENEKIKFIWIGDKTKKHINKKKKEYGLSSIPNLICPGYISDKKIINNYYAAADIFCLTSREEPFGSVVLEAMNAKTPVIAFKDSGGFVDVVKDNITGKLCEREDVDGMFNIIKELKDDKIRMKLGEAGNEIARACSFEEYCMFYMKLLNQS